MGAVMFRHGGGLPVPFLLVPLLAHGNTDAMNWILGFVFIIAGEAIRLAGVAADTLDLNDDEIAAQLQGSFLGFRLRNQSVPALPDGPLPPPDTIAGAFIRDVEARITAAEGAGDAGAAAEAREVLRLGRLLLDDPQRVSLV